jgi:ribosomal protein L13E
VRTWFNQAPSKKSRRNKRAAKAEAIFPRPVAGLLRPAMLTVVLAIFSTSLLLIIVHAFA